MRPPVFPPSCAGPKGAGRAGLELRGAGLGSQESRLAAAPALTHFSQGGGEICRIPKRGLEGDGAAPGALPAALVPFIGQVAEGETEASGRCVVGCRGGCGYGKQQGLEAGDQDVGEGQQEPGKILLKLFFYIF